MAIEPAACRIRLAQGQRAGHHVEVVNALRLHRIAEMEAQHRCSRIEMARCCRAGAEATPIAAGRGTEISRSWGMVNTWIAVPVRLPRLSPRMSQTLRND